MDDTLTSHSPFAAQAAPVPQWGLCVAWSLEEPERVGEVVVVPKAGMVGRGQGLPAWILMPGGNRVTGPLNGQRISREQLHVQPGRRLHVVCVGKTPMLHDGREVSDVNLDEGDVIELQNAVVFLVVKRVVGDTLQEVEDCGLVGTSEAMSALRQRIAFVAPQPGHVFITGPSGSGKERVAEALHALSGRKGPFVGRNAATIPAELAAAELFGNRASYPNPGMPERAGLFASADGGTLLLDELGELPEVVQSQLLRALDAGEYQRLGESRVRRSDTVVFAATHRDPEVLKHDLVARFRHRIEVPGLDVRPDDIPSLSAHLLRQAGKVDTSLQRFFEGDHPRLTPALVHSLLTWPWRTHVRELDRLLWECIAQSPESFLDRPGSWATKSSASGVDPASLSVDAVREALAACDGVVSQAWKRLGLRSRDQLRRLMRKHGL